MLLSLASMHLAFRLWLAGLNDMYSDITELVNLPMNLMTNKDLVLAPASMIING